MIEKLGRLGGTSRYFNLDFACVGSDAQKAQGIQDTPEAMVKDMSKVAAGLGNYKRALNIASHTAQAQKIMHEHGVKWKNLLKLGRHSAKRCLIAEGGGAGILRSLWASFAKYPNLTVMTSTKLDDLIVRDGRIVGVAVRRNYAFNAALRSDDRDNKTGKKRTFGARAVQLGQNRFSFVMPTVDFIWGVAMDATTGSVISLSLKVVMQWH